MRKKTLGIALVVILALVAIGLWTRYHNKPGNEIVIGAVLPMTGTAANYGELMKRGITIATDEYNEGIAPGALRLKSVIEDSKSTPKDGLLAMQKLLQADKPVAVMPALSGVVLAVVPPAEQSHVVLLNCPANSPKLRGAGSYVFNLTILSDQESAFLAEYAFNKWNARTAGIFFVNNEMGRGYADSFAAKFTALGGVVKLAEAHDQGGTDFRTTIQKFRAANVDFVFITSYYSESGIFVKQARELGLNTRFLSYAGVETPDFLKIAGDAAEGVTYSQPGMDVNSSDPLTRKFVTEYRRRYNSDPDFWSAQFYEGTRLLASAVASGAKTGEDVRNYLKNLHDFRGIAGLTTFDEKGCVTRAVRFKIVHSGKFEYLPE